MLTRHYREGVRELVLAAREHVSQSAGWPSDSSRKEWLRKALEGRLRKALEGFRDVDSG